MEKPGSSKRLFEDDEALEKGSSSGSKGNEGSLQKKARSSFQLEALVNLGKRTNDEVHGSIDLCPVAVAFIDTPQFQRLRSLKQLGTSEFVYMNTNHTRFEHSLGVYKLAGDMARKVHKDQPNLGSTEKDILCVSLAGLLHDIGHGPFSHVYDGEFVGMMPNFLKANPHLKAQYQAYPSLPAGWCHEIASLMMIDALLEFLGLQIDLHNLDKPLKQIGSGVDALSLRVFDPRLSDEDSILTSRDLVFIKECIWGGPIPEVAAATGLFGFVGRRQEESEWLYNIVSNFHSGLDVDKIDYYARDERRAMNASGQINTRMILEAFVTWGDCTKPQKCFRCKHAATPGRHLMICYPAKMETAAMAFFKKRFDLHQAVYKHKVTAGAAYLLCDILCQADPYFNIEIRNDGAAGKSKLEYDTLPISRAMLNASTFLQLKDSLIDMIDACPNPNLSNAKALIKRWRARQLYKCVGEREIDMTESSEQRIWAKNDTEIKQEMLAVRGVHDSSDGSRLVLRDEDFIVQRCDIHYGLKHENPLKLMRFLPKEKLHRLTEPVESLPDSYSIDEAKYKAQVPQSFQANSIRVFSRTSAKDGLVAHIFSAWLEEIQGEIEITQEKPDHVGHVLASPAMLTQTQTQDSDFEGFAGDDLDEGYAASYSHIADGRHSVTPVVRRK